MTKYITIENEIFEASLVLSSNKTNDEIVPVNRKKGSGGDKNHFFVSPKLYKEFGSYFPLILKDKKENKSNRNNKTIKNYFSISRTLNDLDLINSGIKINYKNENEINTKEYSKLIFSIAKELNLNTNFYIESEIGSAGNGIGFKNWKNAFSESIKLLLLHNTQTNIYLFKKEDEICSYFEFNQNHLTEQEDTKSSSDVFDKGSNIIYYGAPGTGKSHKVKELLKGKKEFTKRITFHPEYDYASFLGGYKPITEKDEETGKEEIKYKFVAQAFTNIYVDAWNDTDNEYYLVIEEINRGNCAEIFGDIFQLLDRNPEYLITPSIELKEHLEKSLFEKGLENGAMALPSNLHILATMNTSDQSLFPMDSAFKRRWDWEYVPIDYIKSEENQSSKFIVKLSETEEFSWIKFIEKINKEHIQVNPNLGMDKCIGNYFIKAVDNKIELSDFINKAIFYLWNDVFKDEEEHIFEENTFYEDFFPIETNGKEKVLKILEKIGLIEHKKD
jgi:hypothetical protein